MGWAYCITSSMDMVTVSCRWLLRPLLNPELMELLLGSGALAAAGWPEVSMPTSRGSNLWGDSPTVLLLREAESDSSGLEWKEEREELVSSVMEDRKGALSEVTAAGVGPRDPEDPLSAV